MSGLYEILFILGNDLILDIFHCVRFNRFILLLKIVSYLKCHFVKTKEICILNSRFGMNSTKGPFSGFGRQKLDNLQTCLKENITNLSCINLFSKSFIQRNSSLKNRGIKFQSHASYFSVV